MYFLATYYESWPKSAENIVIQILTLCKLYTIYKTHAALNFYGQQSW